MKFFTKEWATGFQEDEKHERAVPDYWAYQETISGDLSESLRTFSNTVSIHDALVNIVGIDVGRATVMLELVNGDVQVGYRNLKITYSGVDFRLLDLEKLLHMARDRRTELGYDEIDVSENGRFIHRILSYGSYQDEKCFDVEFHFESFSFAETPRNDRTVEGGRDPIYFIENDDDRNAMANLP